MPRRRGFAEPGTEDRAREIPGQRLVSESVGRDCFFPDESVPSESPPGSMQFRSEPADTFAGIYKEVEIDRSDRNKVLSAATTPAIFGPLVLSAVGHAADAGTEFVNHVWTEATEARSNVTPEEDPAGMVIASIGGTVRLQIEPFREAAEQEKRQAAQQRLEYRPA